MAGIVGALGPLVFVGGLGSTFTFHAVSKKRQNAFVKHQIINNLDLIEDVGFKPLEVDLDLRFYEPWTANPSVSLALLETLEDAKIPVPLFIGSTPIGRGPLTLWVIEEITSKMPKFSGGTLVVLDVNIKLLEYSNLLSLAGPLGSLANAGIAAIGSLI